MTIGPVQLVVLGFEGGEFSGEIVAELGRLRDHDVIRLIDLLFVNKDESGEVTVIEASDLTPDEATDFGATVGALIGLGEGGEQGAVEGAIAGAEALEDGHVFDPEQVWYVTDSIPNGTAAAIALLEHRWAIPVRDAVQRAGGTMLDESWVHPLDLVAVGLAKADEVSGSDPQPG